MDYNHSDCDSYSMCSDQSVSLFAGPRKLCYMFLETNEWSIRTARNFIENVVHLKYFYSILDFCGKAIHYGDFINANNLKLKKVHITILIILIIL